MWSKTIAVISLIVFCVSNRSRAADPEPGSDIEALNIDQCGPKTGLFDVTVDSIGAGVLPPYDPVKPPYELDRDFEITITPKLTPISVAGKQYEPQKLILERAGSPVVIYETSNVDSLVNTSSFGGFESLAKGEVYSFYVLLKEKGGTIERKVPVFRFKPENDRVILSLTGKAWSAIPKSGGDVTIIPAISLGVGIRYAKDYNDQDIIAVRGVLAVGANIATEKVEGEAAKFEMLLGAELGLGRYASFGVAWSVLEKDPPLVFLFSYGELYPSPVAVGL